MRGEGKRNHRYQQGNIRWPIQRETVRPQTEQEAEFNTLNGEVNRMPRTTKAQAFWILEEELRLAGRWAELQRKAWASAREVRQARRDFHKFLQVDRWHQVQHEGAEVEVIMASGKAK